LSSACTAPNCAGFAVCFSRLSVLTKPNLTLRSGEAIRTAKQQKSISLAMRAEASYANTATEKRRWHVFE
jgi:hypothetical protein